MAEVFKGKMFAPDGSAQAVAIKKILPHLAEDRRFVEMFIAEAKMAMQLNHANIAQTLELGRHGEDHFISMEYISGRDLLALHNHFRRTKSLMPTHLVAYVAARVAEGLDYAHRKKDGRGEPLGIIHRDISPQNVLISFEGAVKLIDFGIAKARKRSYEATRAGVLKGKFGYMSPEQVGKGEVDQRSDIFALGTVIHELLTGQRLFLGENDFATLDLVKEAQIPPPSVANPNVHPELDRILLKALAKHPDERYQTSGEMADDLERYLHATGNSLSRKPLSDWMSANFQDEIQKEIESNRLSAGIYLEDGRVCYMEIDDEDDDTSLWDGKEARVAAWIDADTAKEHLLKDSVINSKSEEDLAHDLFGETDPQAETNRSIVESAKGVDEKLPIKINAPPENYAVIASRATVDYIQEPAVNNKITRRQIVFTIAIIFMAIICGILAFNATQKVELKQTGIIIQTEPREEISIYINGRLVSEDSPYVEKNIEPSKYEIVIEKPGYQNWITEVDLKEGVIEKIDAKLISDNAIPAKIKLRIYPLNAELYINSNKIEDNNSDKIYEFKGGENVLFELKSNGYEPFSKKIITKANTEEVIDLHMIATSGTLFIDSTPPGDVYLNNKKVGRAPCRPEGLDVNQDWALKIVRKGYKDHEETIRFGARRFIHVEAQLTKR
ncbi:protein kinase [Myxococcota bacterium]|nr:protein kinase [Myxococcota bacterium]